jgi:anti-sigma B factor antagonist
MLPTEFSLTTARVGEGTYVVSVYGELDLHSVGSLEAEFDAAVARGAQRLVVDLAGVSFMDSTALGAIVAAHRNLRAAAGEFSIVSDDPRVVRVFQITGLDRTLRLRSSLADAVNELVQVGARA